MSHLNHQGDCTCTKSHSDRHQDTPVPLGLLVVILGAGGTQRKWGFRRIVARVPREATQDHTDDRRRGHLAIVLRDRLGVRVYAVHDGRSKDAERQEHDG